MICELSVAFLVVSIFIIFSLIAYIITSFILDYRRERIDERISNFKSEIEDLESELEDYRMKYFAIREASLLVNKKGVKDNECIDNN